MTESRAATVAADIEAAIISGKIESGERLGTKDEIRRRYDVAYGTLNETLRILQQRGYVTSRTGPRGGLFATIPTSSDRLRHLLSALDPSATLLDCATVRHALEEAVTLDATRTRSRADIADLRRILRAMAAATDEPPVYLRENWRLHRRIAECCHNRILANLYITLLDANEPAPGMVVPDRRRVAKNADNLKAHTVLVEAIASGSVERARRAVAEHEAFFAGGEEVSRPPRAAPARKRPKARAAS